MKKSGQNQELKCERILELYPDVAIWLVHVERTREQDRNARLMDNETFELLTKTIEEDKRLESMPFGYVEENKSKNLEFRIISGHHRVRAARAANLTEIYVMVDEKRLTRSQVTAKQLAHNAISGKDDKNTIMRMYQDLVTIEDQLRSGITEAESKEYATVPYDGLAVDFDMKTITLAFLPAQADDFEKAVQKIIKSDKVYAADLKEFDKFKEAVIKTSKTEEVRNIAGIASIMSKIVLGHYRRKEKEARKAKREQESA